jgi:hypothetical protein
MDRFGSIWGSDRKTGESWYLYDQPPRRERPPVGGASSNRRESLTRAREPDLPRARREGPQPRSQTDRLRVEANHIHRALFGHDAPEEVQRQYASALEAAPLADWPPINLERLIERGVDLEALELALRRSRRRNALTQRFQVLCYLAEVRPDNIGRFVNERCRRPAGWLILGLHLLRSLYKLAKGRRLMRVHDIR